MPRAQKNKCSTLPCTAPTNSPCSKGRVPPCSRKCSPPPARPSSSGTRRRTCAGKIFSPATKTARTIRGWTAPQKFASRDKWRAVCRRLIDTARTKSVTAQLRSKQNIFPCKRRDPSRPNFRPSSEPRAPRSHKDFPSPPSAGQRAHPSAVALSRTRPPKIDIDCGVGEVRPSSEDSTPWARRTPRLKSSRLRGKLFFRGEWLRKFPRAGCSTGATRTAKKLRSTRAQDQR